MAVYAIGDLVPRVHPEAFVHPQATVIGDVVVEARASVWPSAVLRGDFGRIEVKEGSSIQDGTVVHAGPDIPVVVGPFAVVGHNAHLEGCTVEPWALVGSMSTVLHRCIVRSHATVGANALVPNDTVVPTGSMALGVPCKIVEGRVREYTHQHAVETYIENAARFRTTLRRIDEGEAKAMDVVEAIGSARAMRYFLPDPVPGHLVEQLTWAATRASSAHNSEPWEFVVVRDPGTRRAVADVIAEAVRANDPLPSAASESDRRLEAGVRNLFANMADAPVYIFVCARNSYPHGRPNEKFMWSAIGGATQNMLIAARALGLGVAPTMFHLLAEPRIREILRLPDDLVLGVTAVVGWPARPFGPVRRRPLNEMIHHDRW